MACGRKVLTTLETENDYKPYDRIYKSDNSITLQV